MIDKKYIIAIGLIIFLLVIYYLYDDLRNLKASFIPVYEKTLKLEKKIEELEKKTGSNSILEKKNKNDTSVFSISYQSDTNKVLPIKYENTESEAKRIKERIERASNEKKSP